MNFEFIETISYPREQVYQLLKDGLTKLVPLVPNIESVTELERRDLGNGETKIVNEWQGAPDGAPRIIRPFIKPEMHVWRDFAHWKDKESLVEWEFESPMMGKFYDCSGVNYVEENGPNSSLVRLTGSLVTHPERIKGVPTGLAKRVAPTVEKWIINLVSPNLAELPKAVQVYLDQQ